MFSSLTVPFALIVPWLAPAFGIFMMRQDGSLADGRDLGRGAAPPVHDRAA